VLYIESTEFERKIKTSNRDSMKEQTYGFDINKKRLFIHIKDDNVVVRNHSTISRYVLVRILPPPNIMNLST